MPNAKSFEEELLTLMHQYSMDVSNDIEKIVRDIAHQAVVELQRTAPVGRTKDYSKSFGVHVKSERGKVHFTAYAKAPHYRLTHLLESGHRTRLKSGKYGNKASTSSQQHFAPVQEWADKEVLRRIEEALRK